MSIWSSKIIEELAYNRVIIFFGSGVSACAKKKDGSSPKTWREFITDIQTITRNATDDDKEYIKNCLDKEDYLSALQAIKNTSDSGEYGKAVKDAFESDARNPYEKMPAHKLIRDLDCKVVITTNFDKIYESCCSTQGYTTLTYNKPTSIIDALKSPNSLIIKAHGTIEEVNDIIFTAEQYYTTQEKYPEFYDILFSLFLTNTVLFLGYSLNDPDINLVLQMLHKTASESSPHYIALPRGIPEQKKQLWKKTYNVEIIEYGDSIEDFVPALESLYDDVQGYKDARCL